MKKNNDLIQLSWFREDCAEIWLNRPQSRNAYTKEMVSQLINLLLKLKKNKKIKICLIRARGKDFCAGGDIRSMITKTDLFAGPSAKLKVRYKKYIQKLALVLDELNYLTISVVQGGAVGAGSGLALGCDLVWAHDNAYFLLPFFSIALAPADGSFWRMNRRVGYSFALEALLTSKKINADVAMDIGLVDFIGSEKDLLKKIAEYKTLLFSRDDWSKIVLSLRRSKFQSLSEHLVEMRNLQSKLQLKKNHNRVIQTILK